MKNTLPNGRLHHNKPNLNKSLTNSRYLNAENILYYQHRINSSFVNYCRYIPNTINQFNKNRKNIKTMKYLYLFLAPIIFLSQPAQANDTFSSNTLKFIYSTSDWFSIKPYNSYHYGNDETGDCEPFTIDYKEKLLTFKGKKEKSTYDIVTEDIHSRIVGEWFEGSSEEGIDVTALISRNKRDYDYDYLEVDHNNKTYTIREEDEVNANYFLLNDFIAVDVFDDDFYYIYFITSLTENEINYVDCTGNTFTEIRHTGQKHQEIPEGYTKAE